MTLGSCKNVESAEIPNGIEEITMEIFSSGKTDEFLTFSPIDAIQWLQLNCSTASTLFSEFIRKHSHRSLKEVMHVKCYERKLLKYFNIFNS